MHMADAYRPLLEFLAYTGLRIGETLGLRWCDVDFEAGVLRVRQQLSRSHAGASVLMGTALWER